MLVEAPALRPSGAHSCEHEIGAGERFSSIRGDAEGGRVDRSGLLGEGIQDRVNHVEAHGVHIVQRHLGHPRARLIADQRLPDERGAEASAAKDRELHSAVASASPAAEAPRSRRKTTLSQGRR